MATSQGLLAALQGFLLAALRGFLLAATSSQGLLFALSLLAVVSHHPSTALNNGLGRTPPMGYNTWFDFFGPPNDEGVRAVADAMESNGLLAAGYNYIVMDDLWSNARDNTTEDWIPNPDDFPNGLPPLLDYVRGKGFVVGGYTSRGIAFCGAPNGTGSEGHEVHDADWFVKMGYGWVKSDSCGGPSDPQAAFAQYALFRDALNATGRPTFFNLCGWSSFYAPVGAALANTWRIGPDAASWFSTLVNIDIDSDLWMYAGPGGFNDPDMIGSCDCAGVWTGIQKRGQFTVYAWLSAPLILSAHVRNLTAFDLETYTNEEVIAVNQDALARQAQRLVGNDLERTSARARLRRLPWTRGETLRALDGPVVALQPCTVNQSDPSGAWLLQQQWTWEAGDEDNSSPHHGDRAQTLQLVRTAAPISDSAGACMNVDACGTEVIGFPCRTGPGSSFTYSAGYFEPGPGDISGIYNLTAAQSLCLSNEYCLGFSFASNSSDCNLSAGGTCNMTFTSSPHLVASTSGFAAYALDWSDEIARPFALRIAQRRAAEFGDLESVLNGSAGGGPRWDDRGERGGDIRLSDLECPSCPSPSDYCNFQWTYNSTDGTIRSGMSGGTLCLTAVGVGEGLVVSECSDAGEGGNSSQQWAVNQTDGTIRLVGGGGGQGSAPMCATYNGASGVNIFGKPLSTSSFGLAAFNGGFLFEAVNVTCDFETCLGPATGWEADQLLMVRDVWAHAFLPNRTAGEGIPFEALPPIGGVQAFVLTPVWE